MSSAAALSAVLQLPVGKAMHIADADGSPTQMPDLLDSPSSAAEPLPVTGAYQATPYAPSGSNITGNLTPALPVMLLADHDSKAVSTPPVRGFRSDHLQLFLPTRSLPASTVAQDAPGCAANHLQHLVHDTLLHPECSPAWWSRSVMTHFSAMPEGIVIGRRFCVMQLVVAHLLPLLLPHPLHLLRHCRSSTGR